MSVTASLVPPCVLLFVWLFDQVDSPRPEAQAIARSPQPMLSIEPRPLAGPIVAHGTGFASNEVVALYAAQSPRAAFADYIELATVTAQADGTFTWSGAAIPAVWSRFGSTWELAARGQTSTSMLYRPIAAVDPPAPGLSSAPLEAAATPTASPAALPTPMPLPPPTPTPLPDPNAVNKWYVEFFPTRDMLPAAVYSRNESLLDDAWCNTLPPFVTSSSFSAVYSRSEEFKATTSYEFVLDVKGAARIYLDGGLVIDEWHDGPQRQHKVTFPVVIGSHVLRVEYYNVQGPALVRLNWIPDVFYGWQGRYYSNDTLSGSPALVRDDPKIDFNWGTGAPDPRVPGDHFSVKWERKLCLHAGQYKLAVDVDDWVRVYINGALVTELDNWNQQPTHREATRYLRGCPKIEVQYVELSGDAKVSFRMDP